MSKPVRPKRRSFAWLLLILLVGLSLLAAMRLGYLPQRFSPFPPISLAERPDWFVDTRLAALRLDRPLCDAVLKEPHIDAVAVADQPYKNGCGWVNAVRFSQAGGARIGAEKLACEMAAALSLWVEHEVQPLAKEILGERVTAIGDMGIYDCRNILGNPMMKNIRSQHATANAIDISGFTLESGKQISILRDWQGDKPEARFLKEVHRRACRYFRVALGPEYNAAHKNHFHLDRGAFSRCK
ncbi:MAG: extensin family protein [Deltaproteobacteria bacterium]